MTVFDLPDKDELEIQRKRIAELEKVNQDLRAENIALSGDVTELKKVEESLRKSEERFRAFVATSSEIVYRVSPNWSEMRYLYGRGFLANTESPSRNWLQEYVLPEDHPHVMSVINEAISTKSTYELEHRVRLADGSVGWILSRAVPMMDSNSEIVEWFGTASDITKRKAVEEELSHKTEMLQRIFDNIPVLLVMWDPHLGRFTLNRYAEQVLGWTTDDANSGDIMAKVYPDPEYRAEVSAYMLSLKKGWREWICTTKNGQHVPIGWANIFLTDDTMIGIGMDLRERKKAEAKLKETLDNLENLVRERTEELQKAYNSLKKSEKILAEAQEMAHVGSWEWDIVNDKAYWSEEMYRIFGLNPQESEITYDLSLNYIHPEDRNYVDNAIKEAFKGEPYSIDYRIVSADGKEHTVHAYREVVFNDENIPVLMRGTVQDITERKKTEEKIQMLANLVESSDDAIITESLDCIITSWNRGAEQVYGYLAEEILGKPISTLAPPHLEDETRELVERVKQGERIQQYETLRLRKDGTIINVSITLSPVFDIYGKLIAVSLIYRDITKRKEAEEALAKTEIIRQREIHHRIKNNLQVISSLLDLQAGKFKDRGCINDSEVLEAFRESHDRVLSIALIHEELHEGEGEDALNFSLYLQRLVENLFRSYRLGDSNISLNMSLKENIFFGMDTAVPLGMIVNELVSNSLKHAFPDTDTGEIQIKLYSQKDMKDENTEYVLIVSDNGIGIPKNTDFENPDTLGLQLINTLVDQLDGEINLIRDNGTEFVISFSA